MHDGGTTGIALSQPQGVHTLHSERRNYAANEGTFPLRKVIFHVKSHGRSAKTTPAGPMTRVALTSCRLIETRHRRRLCRQPLFLSRRHPYTLALINPGSRIVMLHENKNLSPNVSVENNIIKLIGAIYSKRAIVTVQSYSF